MFCPNCGTQNPDTAQTCSKCAFHLKSAAAPKFKGTMLMMNQPGALQSPPAPPVRTAPGAAPAPAPGPTPQVPNKLKGTMVGVAPMAAGAPLPPPMPPPMAAPGPPAPLGATAAPAPYAAPPAPPAEIGAAFSPPIPQPGVNPLGGTVAAADAGMFAAFAAQQQGHAPPFAAAAFAPTAPAAFAPGPPPPFAPGAPPGYPPGASGAHGTSPMQAAPPPPYPPYHAPPPPPPYGGQSAGPPIPAGLPPFAAPPPPGAPGAPPFGPMNQPAPGAPGADGYAQPPGGYGYGPGMAPMAPYGASPGAMAGASGNGNAIVGPMGGTLKSEVPPAVGPTRRNALMTLLLPVGVMFGGIVLSVILSLISPALGGIGTLVTLGGAVWSVLIAIRMIAELRAVTRSEALAWWPLIVPFYNMYFMWLIVPQEVAKA
ncbi:MAG: zinc ribbon domain-containing protein, partial [Myxococcales bacterium]|nr:zinc ribbon domain-containing protein [Myxococcales bacterium]